jgi:hypothetical protein
VNRSLPNSCNILATGKSATLAYTAYATNGTTVLAARVFGAMTEIGATAVYLGPDIVVDASLSGFVVYDADGSPGAAGTVVDVRPFEALTGYSLAPAGLDAIAVPNLTGPATTFPGMVVQTWRRFFRKATRSTTQILTYDDAGATPITTQPISDDGSGNEVQGAAS